MSEIRVGLFFKVLQVIVQNEFLCGENDWYFFTFGSVAHYWLSKPIAPPLTHMIGWVNFLYCKTYFKDKVSWKYHNLVWKMYNKNNSVGNRYSFL